MEGKYQTYGGIYSKKGKVYLAEFSNKETGEVFQKFGVTSSYDAADRFRYPEYDKWDIRILSTAYGTKEEVEDLERQFHKKYPKNFYLKEKIKGVTEIVKMTKHQRYNAIQEMREHSHNLKLLREKNENIA